MYKNEYLDNKGNSLSKCVFTKKIFKLGKKIVEKKLKGE